MGLVLAKIDEAVAMVAASAGSVASRYIRPRKSCTIRKLSDPEVPALVTGVTSLLIIIA